MFKKLTTAYIVYAVFLSFSLTTKRGRAKAQAKDSVSPLVVTVPAQANSCPEAKRDLKEKRAALEKICRKFLKKAENTSKLSDDELLKQCESFTTASCSKICDDSEEEAEHCTDDEAFFNDLTQKAIQK
ncbi:MAG: hypothetical protein D6797_01515, partial [Bdellovibrio sp.]